jgi:hypothetical protein
MTETVGMRRQDLDRSGVVEIYRNSRAAAVYEDWT